MPIFTNRYEPPPPEEIPETGEPPVGLKELEELVHTIDQSGRSCDHTCKQIKEFLQAKNIDVEPAFRWLRKLEIFCDCALVKAFQHKVLPQFSRTPDKNK